MRSFKFLILAAVLGLTACGSAGSQSDLVGALPEDVIVAAHVDVSDDFQREEFVELFQTAADGLFVNLLIEEETSAAEREELERFKPILESEWELVFGFGFRGALENLYDGTFGDNPGDSDLYVAFRTVESDAFAGILEDRFGAAENDEWDLSDVFIRRNEDVFLLGLRESAVNVMENNMAEGGKFVFPEMKGKFVNAWGSGDLCVDYECEGDFGYFASFEDGRLNLDMEGNVALYEELGKVSLVDKVSSLGAMMYVEFGDLSFVRNEFWTGFTGAAPPEEMFDVTEDIDKFIEELGLDADRMSSLFTGSVALVYGYDGGLLPDVGFYVGVEGKREEAEELMEVFDEFMTEVFVELNSQLDEGVVMDGRDLVVKDESLEFAGDVKRFYLDSGALDNQLKMSAALVLPDGLPKMEIYYGISEDDVMFVAFDDGFVENFGKEVVASEYGVDDEAVSVMIVEGEPMANYLETIFALVEKQGLLGEDEKMQMEKAVAAMKRLSMFYETSAAGVNSYITY